MTKTTAAIEAAAAAERQHYRRATNLAAAAAAAAAAAEYPSHCGTIGRVDTNGHEANHIKTRTAVESLTEHGRTCRL